MDDSQEFEEQYDDDFVDDDEFEDDDELDMDEDTGVIDEPEDAVAEKKPVTRKIKVRARPVQILLAEGCIFALKGIPSTFQMQCSSVTGKDYEFLDPKAATQWLGRRIYNGEKVSDNVPLFLEMYKANRAFRAARKVVANAFKWLDEVDVTSKRSRSTATIHLRHLQKLVDNPLNLPETVGLTGMISQAIQHIDALADPEEHLDVEIAGDEPSDEEMEQFVTFMLEQRELAVGQLQTFQQTFPSYEDLGLKVDEPWVEEDPAEAEAAETPAE